MLMYSQSHELLCEVASDGTYHVINGNWCGIRRGNDFEVLWNEEGHADNYHSTITDWVEITREDFDKKYPNFGY